MGKYSFTHKTCTFFESLYQILQESPYWKLWFSVVSFFQKTLHLWLCTMFSSLLSHPSLYHYFSIAFLFFFNFFAILLSILFHKGNLVQALVLHLLVFCFCFSFVLFLVPNSPTRTLAPANQWVWRRAFFKTDYKNQNKKNRFWWLLCPH